jgi:L-malate glycosyltransferase
VRATKLTDLFRNGFWHMGHAHETASLKVSLLRTRKVKNKRKQLRDGNLKFVTIFPLAENVHLIKDVGMIPCLMSREQHFDSTLVCFSNSEQMPYLNQITTPLKIHTISREENYCFGSWPAKGVLRYLIRESSSINVLMLFHNNRETRLQALLYKTLNPKGIIYIKLDFDTREKLETRRGIGRFKGWLSQKFENIFLRVIPSLVTVESSTAYTQFLRMYPSAKRKLKVMPNGIDQEWLDARGFNEKSENKRNLVLSVGRIGSHQKNSEMLLDCIANIQVGDWQFVFAGPVSEEFRQKVNDLVCKKPELIDRIILTGNIASRLELYEWYSRAKVFCMTSRWEGFSLAMVDALYFGCHIITTPISSAEDITNHSKVGTIISSENELRSTMKRIIEGKINLETTRSDITEYAKIFSWSRICHDLNIWLQEC